MGTKYSTILVGGDVPDYGDNAPADDGSQVESNRVKYATIQTDVGNPLHEGVKDMDGKLVAHVNEGPDTETGTVTLTTADHNKVLECSGTFTLSLPAPASNKGFQCTVKNAGSGTVTVDVSGGANIDGAASVALAAGDARKVYVNDAESAYFSVGEIDNAHASKISGGTLNNMVKQSATGDLVDAGFLVTEFPLTNVDITGGTAETDVDDDDEVAFYDTSAGANRKATIQDFKVGSVIQSVSDFDGNLASTTTVMPADNSIPQITEGGQVLSISITPTNANNKLKLSANLLIAVNQAGAGGVAALFKTGTSDALSAVQMTTSAANDVQTISIYHEVTAGGTSSQTYTVRIGPSSAGTAYLNGNAAGRKYGGVANSFLLVEEIKT